MSDQQRSTQLTCDLLVIGSGAGGLSTAITARKAGLDVIVVEKEACFGGTTAFSGGVLWIPGNRHALANGVRDTREAARTYLRGEAGTFYDDEAIEAFLEHGPAMLDFFERETDVKFVPTLYPDYHPNLPGGVDIGRSVVAAPFDARGLGRDLERLRPPLKTITFIGMMFNSSNADLRHFFNATRSLKSAWYVTKRLASHLKDLALYRRGVQVTSGNALAARLAKSALDLGIPILTNAAALGSRCTTVGSSARRSMSAACRPTSLRGGRSCSHAAASRTTSSALPARIRMSRAAASTCRRCQPAIPATARSWPSALAAASRFAIRSRPHGCRCRACRSATGASACFRICSTATSRA